MENSKLPRRKMSKINTRTRTIGTNTDNNHGYPSKCLKCHESRKLQLYPYYFPFPFPICSCMVNYLQNNCLDVMNICCKCDNSKAMNMCNSHHCLKTCSSHSESSSSSNEACTCKNSSTSTVANNESKELNERKSVSASLRSSRHAIKEEPIDYESDEEVPIVQNITKYADDYLESNYRYKYGPKQKTENDNIKEDSKSISKPQSSKHLLNHLLKPNKTKNLDKSDVIEEEEDSDDLIELEENDESETIFEDDELSVKTVIRPSEDDIDEEKTVEIEERRPTRVNITHQNSSKRPQSQPAGNKNPRPSEDEMLMMLKALVTTQYDNNSERLNKILNHIETGTSKKYESKKSNKSNNASRCSSPKLTSPRKKVNKTYGSVIPKLSDNKK